MGSQTSPETPTETPVPVIEAPFKYTKDSFIGVRDAWLGFAANRLSKAAAALEQVAEKLPDAVKSKIPLKAKPKSEEGNGASTETGVS